MVCSDRCIMGQVVDWHGGPLVFSGMVGRGYFLGIVRHGGLAWWDVFLGIFDVDRCIRGSNRHFFWAFLGVFLGIFKVSWVFLGIFWVDRYIFSADSMAWVSNRRRIGGVGGGSGGRCWLQLVCVWLGVCGRR